MNTVPDQDEAIVEGAVSLRVEEADAGQRLDLFLTARLANLSRSRLQTLIRSGAVTDGRETLGDPGQRVKQGDHITVDVPPLEPAAPEAEAIPLNIIYEDDQLIVIDKPPGMVVHPAPGHRSGTLVNALLAHCGESLSGIGGVRRPGIVHRLDKDTSGLLVAAKTEQAHKSLAEQFSAHGVDGRLHRAYVAFVWGELDRSSGTIDVALARSRTNRTRIGVARTGGRRAVTHFLVEEKFAVAGGGTIASRLKLELETGRTHQIRVHLAHQGHPVMGDLLYAAGFKASSRNLNEEARTALRDLGRQALHAAELSFEHPVHHRRLTFSSPVPTDMSRLEAALRQGGVSKRSPPPKR